MIIGKSNHPVTVKRIEVNVWRLRDEIEAAIAKRLNESNTSEVNIDDLKSFYSQNSKSLQSAKDNSLEAASDENLDASGNPMDDDALEMMRAMQGDAEEESSAEASENVDSDEDEATRAALAMLEGQGVDAEAQMMAEEIIESEQNESSSFDNFKRTPPSQDHISEGFTLLSDINMDEILFFTREPYVQGSSVVMEFQIPTKFIVSAEITKCVNIARNSKIISSSRPQFRIQARFTYPYSDERESLRNFLKSIELEIPPSPKKVKKQSEDEDDDFEDLGL